MKESKTANTGSETRRSQPRDSASAAISKGWLPSFEQLVMGDGSRHDAHHELHSRERLRFFLLRVLQIVVQVCWRSLALNSIAITCFLASGSSRTACGSRSPKAPCNHPAPSTQLINISKDCPMTRTSRYQARFHSASLCPDLDKTRSSRLHPLFYSMSSRQALRADVFPSDSVTKLFYA